MRLLFSMDYRNYDPGMPEFIRPSVRGIILRGDRLVMVYSREKHYYKFPGGGMEPGESRQEVLCREVREEAGMLVEPDSIREYGMVPRRELGEHGAVLVQDNYYYFCTVSEHFVPQELDAYEAEEGFTPCLVSPGTVIAANRSAGLKPIEQHMAEREARVLECLMADGWLAPAGESKVR